MKKKGEERGKRKVRKVRKGEKSEEKGRNSQVQLRI